MKKFKKITLFLLMIVVLLTSACSLKFPTQSTSNQGKTPDVDTSGKGLTVKFDVDDNWISTKRVDYTISLENSGLNEVVLNDENIKLSTIQSKNELGSVFTHESITTFKNSITSENGVLTLSHDEKRENIRGSLFVKDDFFADKTYEKIDYILNINYDYETEFSNNLEIDLKSKKIMKVLDKVSQAAPVNIYKIEITPYKNEEFIINYYFKDNGPASANDKTISIKKNDINIIFRQKPINVAKCKLLTKINNEYVELQTNEIILNKKNTEAILGCKVNLGDIEEKITTATAGTFKYEYGLKFTGSIKLPKKRKNNIDWD